jgi:hypothetical protein
MKQIVINIKSCNDCLYLDHTGAFTEGGAKPCCNHKDIIKTKGNDCFERIIPYKTGFINENKSMPFNYPNEIPEWCPL